MKDFNMNEQITYLIDAVVQWQLAGADPDKIDRAKIIDIARGIACESGKCYFLEWAPSPPKEYKIDWFSIARFDEFSDAIEEMEKKHSEDRKSSYRVVCLQKVEHARRQ